MTEITAGALDGVRRWVVPAGYAGAPAGSKEEVVMVRLDDLRRAMGESAATLSGDCPVCGREDVALKRYRKAGTDEVTASCADERACFAAWRDRKYADQ